MSAMNLYILVIGAHLAWFWHKGWLSRFPGPETWGIPWPIAVLFVPLLINSKDAAITALKLLLAIMGVVWLVFLTLHMPWNNVLLLIGSVFVLVGSALQLVARMLQLRVALHPPRPDWNMTCRKCGYAWSSNRFIRSRRCPNCCSELVSADKKP